MTNTDRGRGLVWFRRDLRLEDNPAWAAAATHHSEVVAIFVLEPRLMNAASAFRRDQLLAHLGALDEQLQALGGRLVVRSGPATAAIPDAIRECEASALYFNADFTPFSLTRDAAVATVAGVPVRSFDGLTAHAPGAVLTKKGDLSQIFMPFYRAWVQTAFAPWPSVGQGRPVVMPSEPIPHPAGRVRHEPGAAAAWQRVVEWLEKVDDYTMTRDFPATPGTSALSADLKFGILSPRTLIEVVGAGTPGRVAFVRQLAWRDWWAHTLALRPEMPNVALREPYDNIEWRDDSEGFTRWCDGRTGYPIVDAGMRQLIGTGWMHNRVRMICASFLVKDLLIDWRKGERFFRHHLIDADVAQNAGNWQWVAGTGPDAAPYFRIFNPTLQGQRFDPDGEFVRRWVPELAGLAASVIHHPAVADPGVLTQAGVVIGDTYPAPLVEHGTARTRAIQAYQLALR